MAACAQEEAEAFLAELRVMDEAHITRDGYEWPSINYSQVSTETCQALFGLVDEKIDVRGPREVVPETPQQIQIARHLDSVLMEREYLAKKRVFAAQTLDERIRKDLVPIFDFLRAARRNSTEHFTFPHHKKRLLDTLVSIEETLYMVGNMVRGNDDLEETEPDTEAGDITLVECQVKAELL